MWEKPLSEWRNMHQYGWVLQLQVHTVLARRKLSNRYGQNVIYSEYICILLLINYCYCLVSTMLFTILYIYMIKTACVYKYIHEYIFKKNDTLILQESIFIIIIKLDFENFRCEWVCPGLQCLWTWWPVHQSGRKLHLQLSCWLDGPWLSHRSVSGKKIDRNFWLCLKK